MKKIILFLILCLSVVLFIIFGCSKSESPTTPAAPTATLTPTATFVSTSTPAPSPNISGNLFLPASASGKQFAVIADNDNNTANGYVSSLIGICPAATNFNYSIQVPNGTYYVYAYVDVNNSGLTGPGGLDYYGMYGSQVTTPNGGVDITLTQLPITVTLNITQPGNAAGNSAFFGLFTGNTYEILNAGPVAGGDLACPSGTNYNVTFTVNPADAGTYYLIGFVDVDGSCGSNPTNCFPQEGDYLKIYGGSGVNWPASPNVTINNDITLNMTLENVVSNVFGTAYLPASVSNKEYTIFASTVPLSGDMNNIMLITKTASTSGNSVNYGIFVPIPGMHYLTFIMDVDGSGWNNAGSGPVSIGDYAGVYGVPTPILNWITPFPPAPNANLPSSGFNIYCDTYPGNTPPATPVPTSTPTPGGQTGSITINLTIPSGQNGKGVIALVDMDLNPSNGNEIALATAVVSGLNQQFNLTNIPVGSYYIYAATSNIDEPPVAGDAVGIYGTTFPTFPSSPNANVTNGGNLNANITMVVATNNVSGRVYMPYSCSVGNGWIIFIDTDLNPNNFLVATKGTINNSNTYFDYSMFLPLPGNYYIYTLIDFTGDGIDNEPDCGDFMGLYNFPNPVYMTPANNYNNINITTNDWMLCNP